MIGMVWTQSQEVDFFKSTFSLNKHKNNPNLIKIGVSRIKGLPNRFGNTRAVSGIKELEFVGTDLSLIQNAECPALAIEHCGTQQAHSVGIVARDSKRQFALKSIQR